MRGIIGFLVGLFEELNLGGIECWRGRNAFWGILLWFISCLVICYQVMIIFFVVGRCFWLWDGRVMVLWSVSWSFKAIWICGWDWIQMIIFFFRSSCWMSYYCVFLIIVFIYRFWGRFVWVDLRVIIFFYFLFAFIIVFVGWKVIGVRTIFLCFLGRKGCFRIIKGRKVCWGLLWKGRIRGGKRV